MGSRAHHAGVGVRADPLHHTGRGPVVEGQLSAAVAAHPDPHSPQQHRHTGHGLLIGGRHTHIMVGLGLHGGNKRNLMTGMSLLQSVWNLFPVNFT